MKLKVSEVKVGDRFREKFEGIEELMVSIQKHGLIEPIVVDENNNLIAGERRLKAFRTLGMEEIEAKCISDLSELEKKEIELEENIQRKAFTWQEEITAKNVLHELKQRLHGEALTGVHGKSGWSIRDTAKSLDESLGNVSMDIQLAKGIKAFPELMKEKSKSVAFKKFKSMQIAILEEELAKRVKDKGVFACPEVKHGDAIEEMSKLDASSIDLILTDPPYGIDIGDAQTFGRQSGQKTYEDGEHETFDLLDRAFFQFYRVLKQDRHMIVFCAADKIERVRGLLLKYGFWVHHIPLVWDKGSGSYPGQLTSFVHSHETFLHCMKGARKLEKDSRDVFPISRVSSSVKIHPSEKPAQLMRELIQILSTVGELVLDPFGGSGVVAEAARTTYRKALVIEKDPVYYQKICERMAKTSRVKMEREVVINDEDDDMSE